MECSFALTGKGYVIVAADTTAARSIVKMKTDEDKIKALSPHLLMAYSGEPGNLRSFSSNILYISLLMTSGDTVQFAEYVERNIRLYQIRNIYALRPSAAASWIRRSLAESLRSRKPYSVNLLLGGYDTASHEPHLYWIDYLGTMTSVPFGAHGYGSYFALSLLDRRVSLFSIFKLVFWVASGRYSFGLDTTIGQLQRTLLLSSSICKRFVNIFSHYLLDIMTRKRPSRRD
jgi:20S proteasome alpha/beta subunit